jgi:hypothetical protein
MELVWSLWGYVLLTYLCRYGACQCGSQSNAVNLILKVIFVPIFTYDDLVMTRNHPQHVRNIKINATMVAEPIAPPVAFIL